MIDASKKTPAESYTPQGQGLDISEARHVAKEGARIWRDQTYTSKESQLLLLKKTVVFCVSFTFCGNLIRYNLFVTSLFEDWLIMVNVRDESECKHFLFEISYLQREELHQGAIFSHLVLSEAKSSINWATTVFEMYSPQRLWWNSDQLERHINIHGNSDLEVTQDHVLQVRMLCFFQPSQ